MKAAPASIVLYGVSSPIVVDVEESARRAGLQILAAIQNVDAAPCMLDRTHLLMHAAIPRAMLNQPFLVPLFNPNNRLHASAEAFSLGFVLAGTLIDPTSAVPSAWTLGTGVYINAGCTIGAACTFGDFVFVNRGASIGHHAVIERFASIGPGAVVSGQVRVGAGALVGAGAVIMAGITIGENAVVGPGAVITRDVPPQTLAAGHPVRMVTKASATPAVGRKG